jgi:hypothetical protein
MNLINKQTQTIKSWLGIFNKSWSLKYDLSGIFDQKKSKFSDNKSK